MHKDIYHSIITAKELKPPKRAKLGEILYIYTYMCIYMEIT